MVYCYKFITESPRRFGSLSSRHTSPIRSAERNKIYPRTISTLINTVDYEAETKRSDFLSIPDHELKLLNVLARKREEADERERLANEFKKLWNKENEERKRVVSEITNQYNKYIRVKRDEERRAFEERQLQRSMNEVKQRCDLINSIKYKEMRSADILTLIEDLKTTGLMEKTLIEACKTTFAARRRARLNAIEDWQRRVEMDTSLRRSNEAEKRRLAKLHDAAKRQAISNAFNTWETLLARNELEAIDAAKRASLKQRLAYEDERYNTFIQKRERQWNKRRKIAAFAAKLRDAIRENNF